MMMFGNLILLGILVLILVAIGILLARAYPEIWRVIKEYLEDLFN
jgi:hypothetical protein